MSGPATLAQQLRGNPVALISLAVALSSLGYNTWRNEPTEMNRNVRHAAFEILLKLGELQLVSDYRHYDADEMRGNPVTGWGYLSVISDLSRVLAPPMGHQAEALRAAWQEHWQELGEEQASAERAEVLGQLGTLR